MKSNKKLTWYTVFNFNELELIKTPGSFPYAAYKFFGFDSFILTYKFSNKYNYLHKYRNGLKTYFINRISGNYYIDCLLYLFKLSKKIDVLNIIHFSFKGLLISFLYLLINRDGIVYIPLDSCNNKKINMPLYDKLVFFAIKKRIILSTERKNGVGFFSKFYNHEVLYVPNGIFPLYVNNHFVKKRNYILTVGRIGTFVKDTNLLINSYAKNFNWYKRHNWKLYLVGNIFNDIDYKNEYGKYFNQYYSEWGKNHCDIAKNIFFLGEIHDRDKLYKYYKNSKVFALSSKYESFSYALVEAAQNGCSIVSTNVGCAKDLINFGVNGKISYHHSVNEYSDKLLMMCKKTENINNKNFKSNAEATNNFFGWNNTLKPVINRIYKYRNCKE